MHVIVWRFQVRSGAEAEFEHFYGAGGEWVKLFRRFRGYAGTELLRGHEDEYLTVDRWDTRAAYETFQAEGGDEYRRLDSACERLTTDERLVGHYETL